MLTAPGGNKKVGLRPLHGATRFRAKTKYIPGVRQLQGTALCSAEAQRYTSTSNRLNQHRLQTIKS
jgi:hypothetical protein